MWIRYTEHSTNRNNEPSQARSRGGGVGGGVGGGGVSGGRPTPPPQLPIPKILFHPLGILFHPLANLLCKVCVTGTDRSPPPPWTWNVDDVIRAMSKGGGACECPRVGAFFKLMTARGQCPRGGVRLVFHPSKFRPPPHLAGWLRACKFTIEVHSAPLNRLTSCLGRKGQVAILEIVRSDVTQT